MCLTPRHTTIPTIRFGRANKYRQDMLSVQRAPRTLYACQCRSALGARRSGCSSCPLSARLVLPFHAPVDSRPCWWDPPPSCVLELSVHMDGMVYIREPQVSVRWPTSAVTMLWAYSQLMFFFPLHAVAWLRLLCRRISNSISVLSCTVLWEIFSGLRE